MSFQATSQKKSKDLIAVNAISDQIDYQHQMIQLEEKLNS